MNGVINIVLSSVLFMSDIFYAFSLRASLYIALNDDSESETISTKEVLACVFFSVAFSLF